MRIMKSEHMSYSKLTLGAIARLNPPLFLPIKTRQRQACGRNKINVQAGSKTRRGPISNDTMPRKNAAETTAGEWHSALARDDRHMLAKT